MEDVFSALEDANTPASNAAIADLLAHAEELVALEIQLADLEKLTKALSARSNALKTDLIPTKMSGVGLTDFTTPAGNKIKVEDFVAGSLPKVPEKRATALKELEVWGAEGSIKNEMTLTFEKSQHNEALSLLEELRQRGLVVDLVSSVHPQTYLALIRERLAGGEEVDPEKMGIFIGRKTKVTLAKPKKG